MLTVRTAEGIRYTVGYRSLAANVVAQAVFDYQSLVNAGHIRLGKVTATNSTKSPTGSQRLRKKVQQMKTLHSAHEIVFWLNREDNEIGSMQWWLDAAAVTETTAEVIRQHLFAQKHFPEIWRGA